jgi:AcrR family transcriptional regulator
VSARPARGSNRDEVLLVRATRSETDRDDRGDQVARTRRRILDAAAEVFSEQGYGARLSDIAERAGMKTGSLYYHFDSREDLVAEVLRLGIDGAWARSSHHGGGRLCRRDDGVR